MNNRLLRRFQEYDAEKPEIVTEISGLLGIPINGAQTVEVPNRNSFVYVRLRNSTNELIQAFNEKVSPVYGLPVLVKWVLNRYEIISRDTNRYADWGSFSSFLPRHGSQHSLNFEDGQGGDVSFIYSRQFMPFATIPSGTDGAGTVFVMPHVYRDIDASWNYIGDESSANFLPAKPTDNTARMMLLVWDLGSSDPLIITGSFLAEGLTGTSSVLSAIPTVTNQDYIPLAAIRLVSGTQSLLWDNIYDMRQYAVTTPPPFAGGFVVQDEGTPIGTGSVLNFVGSNIEASIAGGVIRVYVTGSAGSSVDNIGFAGLDEGIPIGTGTVLNVRGSRAVLSRSGTVFALDISPDPVELIGIFGLDDGVPKGTGTRVDFGDNLTASLSGTVLRIDAVAGTPVQTDGFLVQDEGVLLGTGTTLNFVGANVQATLAGGVVTVSITGSSGGASTFNGVRAYYTGTSQVAVGSVLLASGTPISFNAEVFDTDGFHSNTVFPDRFTVPAGMDGKYHIGGGFYADANCDVRLVINRTKIIAFGRAGAGTSSIVGYTVDTVYPLVEGDYVMLIGIGQTVAKTVYTDVEFSPHFWMYLLGS